MNHLSLVEAVDHFGEGVVEEFADAADGAAQHPGFGEMLCVLDRNILGRCDRYDGRGRHGE